MRTFEQTGGAVELNAVNNDHELTFFFLMHQIFENKIN